MPLSLRPGTTLWSATAVGVPCSRQWCACMSMGPWGRQLSFATPRSAAVAGLQRRQQATTCSALCCNALRSDFSWCHWFSAGLSVSFLDLYTGLCMACGICMLPSLTREEPDATLRSNCSPGDLLPAALQAAEPLNTCSIAARLSPKESGLGKPVSAFNGQMGCIYLFADVLSPGDSTTHVCLSVCMSPSNRAHERCIVLVGRLLSHHAC